MHRRKLIESTLDHGKVDINIKAACQNHEYRVWTGK